MAGNARSLTLDVFARRKRAGERLVVLTAYDAPSARIAAAGGVDAILVGDSLGNVVLGHGTTLPVTMDDMVHHTAAVVRAQPGLPVIADMPYGSFHVEPARTVENALRLVKEAGATAVKVEGGAVRRAHIAALLAAEIPVMGHLGLTPQSVNRFGGYKVQGRGAAAGSALVEEARGLAALGCFAIVLECIPASLAAEVTAAVSVPTIGIGAGAACDGQVLVFHDMLGLSDLQAKFVKRYADLGRLATEAVAAFASEVRSGAFPTAAHAYADAGEPAKAEPTSAGGDGYLDGLADGEADA
ncbi:MAG TPA: 3-methyl-2-oxobutanoate hydroxymethyltransferase [Candidatus Krumholzibacteria bacterium]|nr:3-methyl-2-oxobutanoate hydroxymethyltransferase [Candidatus Krumholzibacteria bacterium]